MTTVTHYQISDTAAKPTTAQPFRYFDWVAIACRQLVMGGMAWQFAMANSGAADRIFRAAYANGETPMAAADMLHAVAVERAAGR